MTFERSGLSPRGFWVLDWGRVGQGRCWGIERVVVWAEAWQMRRGGRLIGRERIKK